MNKTASVHIEKLSHDGRGIAYMNEKPVFVTGALPNEQVDVHLLRTYKGITDAVAMHIEKPAADRIQPKCEHFLSCGGCNLQHLSAQAQLRFKQNMLHDHLKHHQIDLNKVTLLDPIDSSPFHYRKKARLGVKYIHKKEKVVIGFRELINPRLITDIQTCPILDEQVGLHLDKLQTLISHLSQPDKLAQIEVAVGEDHCALILRHLYPLTEQDLTLLRQFETESHFTLFLQSKGPDTIKPLDPKHTGELHYHLETYDLTMYFKPDHFTQVNHEINQKLIAQALSLLDIKTEDRILDLFCGIGNFSLPMAKFAQEVVGIEGSAQMTQFAAHNAARNNITNAKFFPYDLTQPMTNLPWTQKKYDKLLIDPPRSGAQEVCESIKQLSPKVIVYISCNPITFARDAGILAQKGYKLTHTGILNMFPNTAHVESMGRFELK